MAKDFDASLAAVKSDRDRLIDKVSQAYQLTDATMSGDLIEAVRALREDRDRLAVLVEEAYREGWESGHGGPGAATSLAASICWKKSEVLSRLGASGKEGK